MNILIVEDDAGKAEAIRSFLNAQLLAQQETASISLATYLSEAVRIVASTSFDLIVLDLMLPYLSDGMADSRAGTEVLKQIRHEHGLNNSAAVIGLSAYPDEVSEFRERFERAGVLIIQYDETGTWQATLGQTLLDALRRRAGKQEVDFLILTALEEERVGYVGTQLEQVGESIMAGLNVRIVEMRDTNATYRGAIVKLRQIGLAAATLDASLALSAFDANVICISGICAGFAARTALGQLIVASPAWEYQAGKWSGNGFQIAPTQIPLPSATRVIIDQVLGSSAFHEAIEDGLDRRLTRPSRWAEPILAPAATGSAVIADATRLQHIEQQHRKVAALDMETFGVYYAAHEVGPRVEHFFSVKCVVDLADAAKDDNLHEYGCAASARATLFLLRRLLDRDRDAL